MGKTFRRDSYEDDFSDNEKKDRIRGRKDQQRQKMNDRERQFIANTTSEGEDD